MYQLVLQQARPAVALLPALQQQPRRALLHQEVLALALLLLLLARG
jgi:hypothetical protein